MLSEKRHQTSKKGNKTIPGLQLKNFMEILKTLKGPAEYLTNKNRTEKQ